MDKMEKTSRPLAPSLPDSSPNTHLSMSDAESLIPTVLSVDQGDDTTLSTHCPSLQSAYGALHEREVNQAKSTKPSPSSSTHQHHAVVNHAHPYSDVAVGSPLQRQIKRNSTDNEARKQHVSYWSLLRDNVNFRWYFISSLVTDAGE